eukprot:TRINITY_DN12386_c1_g1_i6.p1 TRINITY_DN12386_c1_g1~~TRINITY_DN12386_c1_g1_i6.p1  ORF type:complete len:1176 (+),score=196.58 TRINITY_DN12386_c1_g1_i6:68-3595(+)
MTHPTALRAALTLGFAATLCTTVAADECLADSDAVVPCTHTHRYTQDGCECMCGWWNTWSGSGAPSQSGPGSSMSEPCTGGCCNPDSDIADWCYVSNTPYNTAKGGCSAGSYGYCIPAGNTPSDGGVPARASIAGIPDEQNNVCTDVEQLCVDPSSGSGDWQCHCVSPKTGPVGMQAATTCSDPTPVPPTAAPPTPAPPTTPIARDLSSPEYTDTPLFEAGPGLEHGPVFKESPTYKTSPAYTDTPVFETAPGRDQSPTFKDSPTYKAPEYDASPRGKNGKWGSWLTPEQKSSPEFTDTPLFGGAEGSPNFQDSPTADTPDYQASPRGKYGKWGSWLSPDQKSSPDYTDTPVFGTGTDGNGNSRVDSPYFQDSPTADTPGYLDSPRGKYGKWGSWLTPEQRSSPEFTDTPVFGTGTDGSGNARADSPYFKDSPTYKSSPDYTDTPLFETGVDKDGKSRDESPAFKDSPTHKDSPQYKWSKHGSWDSPEFRTSPEYTDTPAFENGVDKNGNARSGSPFFKDSPTYKASPQYLSSPGYTDTPLFEAGTDNNGKSLGDGPAFKDSPTYKEAPMFKSSPGYTDTPLYEAGVDGNGRALGEGPVFKDSPTFKNTPGYKSSPGYSDTPLYEAGADKNGNALADGPAYKASPTYKDTPLFKSSPGYTDTPLFESGSGQYRGPVFQDSPTFKDTPRFKSSPAYTDTPQFEAASGRYDGPTFKASPTYKDAPEYKEGPEYSDTPRYAAGKGKYGQWHSASPGYKQSPTYKDSPDYTDTPVFETGYQRSESPLYKASPTYRDSPAYTDTPRFEVEGDRHASPHFKNSPTYKESPHYRNGPEYTDTPMFESKHRGLETGPVFKASPTYDKSPAYTDTPLFEAREGADTGPVYKESPTYRASPQFSDTPLYQLRVDKESPIAKHLAAQQAGDDDDDFPWWLLLLLLLLCCCCLLLLLCCLWRRRKKKEDDELHVYPKQFVQSYPTFADVARDDDGGDIELTESVNDLNLSRASLRSTSSALPQSRREKKSIHVLEQSQGRSQTPPAMRVYDSQRITGPQPPQSLRMTSYGATRSKRSNLNVSQRSILGGVLSKESPHNSPTATPTDGPLDMSWSATGPGAGRYNIGQVGRSPSVTTTSTRQVGPTTSGALTTTPWTRSHSTGGGYSSPPRARRQESMGASIGSLHNV